MKNYGFNLILCKVLFSYRVRKYFYFSFRLAAEREAVLLNIIRD